MAANNDGGRSSLQAPGTPSNDGEAVSSSGTKHRQSRGTLQERFGKMLSVATKPDSAPRRIKMCPSFAEIYELGREVMPSTHSYMKVKYAKRRADGVDCIVKLRFKPQCFRSREDERSWRRGTEFLLNLPDDANVAKPWEVLEDHEAFYVVMERAAGMDLFEVMEQSGAMTSEVAREVVRQLLQALAHLHSNNAVHKDLKLENVIFSHTPKVGFGTTPGSVKVIDFDTLEEWTPASPTSRDVVGTDQYISQEAYAGQYSPASDIFAAGVIAYKILTGRFPFKDNLFDDEPGENWVGSPKMKEIRSRLKIAEVDWSHKCFRENHMAMDLVQRMLAQAQRQRPTAEDALRHPWFGGRGAADSSNPRSPVSPGGRDVRSPSGAASGGLLTNSLNAPGFLIKCATPKSPFRRRSAGDATANAPLQPRTSSQSSALSQESPKFGRSSAQGSSSQPLAPPTPTSSGAVPPSGYTSPSGTQIRHSVSGQSVGSLGSKGGAATPSGSDSRCTTPKLPKILSRRSNNSVPGEADPDDGANVARETSMGSSQKQALFRS